MSELELIQKKTWLSVKEAVIYTGLHRNTLTELRKNGTQKGTLPYCRIGKVIRYKRTEIDDFFKSHTVTM